jgi:cation:H+ antiporter
VLGLAALVSPTGIAVADSALRFDIPVMVAVAAACLPILFTGYLIARWEGWVFLLYYIAYTALLILGASGNAAHLTLSNALLYFALPLTVLALAAGVMRHLRQRDPRAP